jgi:predicted secreted Zn-dependent protease
MRSSSRQAARYCGGHGRRAIACVVIRPSFTPGYAQDPATGSCTITDVDTDLLASAFIPRWTAPRRVPAYLAWWWRKVVARLGWHEAQHIRIATQHLARFTRLVTGKPCARYGRLARQWSRDLSTAQQAFDQRDYVRLARASAAWLEQAERRFVRR